MRSVKVSLSRAQKLLDQGEKLVKSLEKSGPATLKVENIYLPLNHLFSAATKRAFENEVAQTTIERTLKVVSTTKTKVYDQVRFFGATAVGERKIFDAAQKIANQINALAEKGFITGVLTGSRLILYQLATEPHQLEQWIITSFVALSPEGLEYLRKNPTKLQFPVGGVPLNSDDL
jgi:hypothetical protein